jgi:hypothetical protein
MMPSDKGFGGGLFDELYVEVSWIKWFAQRTVMNTRVAPALTSAASEFQRVLARVMSCDHWASGQRLPRPASEATASSTASRQFQLLAPFNLNLGFDRHS